MNKEWAKKKKSIISRKQIAQPIQEISSVYTESSFLMKLAVISWEQNAAVAGAHVLCWPCSAGHFTSAAWHKKSASCTTSNFVSNVKIGYSGPFHTELPTPSVPGIQSHFALALVHSSSQTRTVIEIVICVI